MDIRASLLLVCTMLFSCNSMSDQKNRIYLVPDGFEGWLCAAYSVIGAPVLPRNSDGIDEVIFNDNGLMETSSASIRGVFDENKFFYYQKKSKLKSTIPSSYFGSAATFNDPEIENSKVVVIYWIGDEERFFSPISDYDDPKPVCGTIENNFVYELEQKDQGNSDF